MEPELIPVEINHSSGLQFRVNLSAHEIQRFQSDEEYARQVTEKYFNLYMNGLVSNVESVEECEEVDAEGENQNTNSYSERRQMQTTVDDETLIRLVSERPPLFDFRLPLKERGRVRVQSLWQEVISELNVNLTVEAISKKWKNIRDSFIRVRGNIKKKIASGSSAEEKLLAEKLQRNHRNYSLLLFLEDSLSVKRTSSNLKDAFDDEISTSSPQSQLTETPSTSRPTSRTSSRSRHSIDRQDLSAQDKAFIEAVQNLPQNLPTSNRQLTPTEHFCQRLVGGLDKLPPTIRNKLELEFLTRLTEMENRYLYNNNED